METILSLKNLDKKYGSVHAVNNLTFDIQKGNVYGILGPNGSGKSTTLGIILNVVNRTSGEFSWFNGGLTTHEALKKVGAIIERPNFYPYMTATQNLKLICKIKEVSSDKIDEKLKQSVNRYIAVINKVKNKFNGRLMILNVTHSLRFEQNNLVDKFNIELNKSLPKNFIDINNLIFDNKKNVINKEYIGDMVHLNNKLQVPVENWLFKNDVITKKRYQVNPKWDNKEIQRKFSYDSKFGCYRIKE